MLFPRITTLVFNPTQTTLMLKIQHQNSLSQIWALSTASPFNLRHRKTYFASYCSSITMNESEGQNGKKEKIGTRGRACVVVLGDLGRSPRMQYHALSLARQVFFFSFKFIKKKKFSSLKINWRWNFSFYFTGISRSGHCCIWRYTFLFYGNKIKMCHIVSF